MEYEKYSKGIVFYSISQFLSITLSFIGNMIFARMISQADMGVYALSLSFLFLFIYIGNFSIGAGIIILGIKYKKKGLFRSISLYRIITLIIFAIIILSLTNTFAFMYNSILLGTLIQIGCILVFLNQFFISIQEIFFSKEKFNFVAKIIIIGQISGFIMTLFLILNNPTTINIYIGLITTVFIQVVLSFLFGSKILFEKGDSNKFEDLKSIIKLTFPEYYQNILLYLYDLLIILFIGLNFSKDETAYYYYAINATMFVLFFTLIIKLIGITAFAKMRIERAQFYVFKLSKLILISIIPTIFLIITYSNFITSLLYGTSYFNSGYILELIIFFVIFRYFNALNFAYFINKKNRIMLAVYQTIALVTFIFSYFISIYFFYNIFCGVFSYSLGEIVLSVLFFANILKETNLTKKILFSKKSVFFIFICILYCGGIFFIKYFIILNQLELLVIVGIMTLLYPTFLVLTKILNKEDIEFLEKIFASIKILNFLFGFIFKIIKRIYFRMRVVKN